MTPSQRASHTPAGGANKRKILKLKPELYPFVNSLMTPLFETQVILPLVMNVGIQTCACKSMCVVNRDYSMLLTSTGLKNCPDWSV